jgi:glycosyltransferase involved in cell wall biosynthesis
VKPNAAPDPGSPKPFGEGFLFAGRLEEEKGIKLLLEAWRKSNVGRLTSLTIAGDGTERSVVQEAAANDPSIRYLGSVSAEKVGDLLDDCSVRIVPSLWFEAAPLAIIESYARGRPVISTNIGANASVDGDEVGWACPEATADDLAATISRASEDKAVIRTRGAAARLLYDRSYRPEVIIQSLLQIYSELIR